MSSSHNEWTDHPGYRQYIDLSEETCAEIESLVTRIDLASALATNLDVSPDEKAGFEQVRDELKGRLGFGLKLLKSNLDILAQERTQSEKTVSFLERQLGKERAFLEVEKASNESKEEEYRIQLRMSRIERELKAQRSKAKTMGEAIGLFQPVFEKAKTKAAEPVPVK
ncbi:MAG TPA: hypothetical protein VEG31_00090 [Thermoproteota archaeon]|nr:hypothetical protein [Thermoproteota archaeon]